MKLILFTSFVPILSVFLIISTARSQTSTPSATPTVVTPTATPIPATPIPLLGAPIRTLQSVSATLTAAQFQAALATVPPAAQSLQQLLGTFVALPAGVTIAQIRAVDVYVAPSGSARIVVQYLR